ncbi:MAG: Protein translocase subunit SecF [Parcubacteria group bacterium GW2011_GWA2_42_18]|nr:MAG: Protein translocase subunit SecF [Parcubacteria group bacterium GW2011_GWA2_42_18]
MFIINNKKIFITISVILVIVAIISIIVFKPVLGVDFRGGSLLEIEYTSARPYPAALKEALKSSGLEPTIQPMGERGYILKTRELTETEHQSFLQTLNLNGSAELKEKSFTSIGPSVGKELRRKAVVSMIVVILAIITYIAYAFRKVSRQVSSWKYGIIAVIALVHDVIIPSGIFAWLAHYYGAEVDTLFVVALLTILGLSVSDTIVVFDRIRENLNEKKFPTFEETVGRSLEQTYQRSINTSVTVILVLLSLVFFGPESTKYFALTLTTGMFFGTYSSIFLASPLLVLWAERGRKK